MAALPTAAPAGFLPLSALAFSTAQNDGVAVDTEHPLPVALSLGAATSTPLHGTTAASLVTSAFTPHLGRPIWIALSGNWTGTVSVQRSTDGGATRRPLTLLGAPWAVFNGNAHEVFGEETAADAAYYLDIALSTGTLEYRVSQ